jgi:hypothetical protein
LASKGVREVWKYEQCGSFGRNLSPIRNEFLKLPLYCVRYHSDDYRTERLVHSIAVVLHVVQVHINVSTYYSIVHYVGILDRKLSGPRTQLIILHLRATKGFETIGDSEILGGCGNGRVLGISKVESFERLGRSEIS